MSVVVLGMKMPKSCIECDIAQKTKSGLRCPIASRKYGFSCSVSLGRIGLPYYCLLRDVGSHGKLVDVDKLLEKGLGGEPFKSVIKRVLAQAETALEAEE